MQGFLPIMRFCDQLEESPQRADADEHPVKGHCDCERDDRILFFVESFATTTGLGYIIMDSWGRADYISLYTGISSMALLGFTLYLILDRIEQHVCRWMSDH